ncbi:MAG: DsbA family protein [Patescibacteria group bacterium UBA2163]
MEQLKTTNSLAIPIAIVIAGVLVAAALFFSGGQSAAPTAGNQQVDQQPQQQTGSTDQVSPVTSEDHIRGNPDAPVKIVEYSDFECPFCKRFHETMNQVMDEYGASGEVAWIYRHFPLEQLHPVKAVREAVVSECVAELGGNDAFWKFTDRFFELTPSNNQTNLETVLPQIIGELGLSQSAVDECVASGRYDQHVQDDFTNAVATGGQGTPWSIIVTQNGDTFPLSGAQPYSAIKQLIDLALQN